LRPAKKSEEGLKREAKYIDYTYWGIRCTFQDEITGLCELHDLGLKPIEAKLAIHGGKPDYSLSDIRDRIEAAWNNTKAQEIVREWAMLYCKDKILLTNLAE
jgi:hypothetical protein